MKFIEKLEQKRNESRKKEQEKKMSKKFDKKLTPHLFTDNLYKWKYLYVYASQHLHAVIQIRECI